MSVGPGLRDPVMGGGGGADPVGSASPPWEPGESERERERERLTKGVAWGGAFGAHPCTARLLIRFHYWRAIEMMFEVQERGRQTKRGGAASDKNQNRRIQGTQGDASAGAHYVEVRHIE